MPGARTSLDYRIFVVWHYSFPAWCCGIFSKPASIYYMTSNHRREPTVVWTLPRKNASIQWWKFSFSQNTGLISVILLCMLPSTPRVLSYFKFPRFPSKVRNYAIMIQPITLIISTTLSWTRWLCITNPANTTNNSIRPCPEYKTTVRLLRHHSYACNNGLGDLGEF